MANVTSDDANMAAYYLGEKGDLERWCAWESRRAALVAEFPLLGLYLETQVRADALREAVLSQLKDRARD